jgi:ABC-2 type transport system ATP-binding protein
MTWPVAASDRTASREPSGAPSAEPAIGNVPRAAGVHDPPEAATPDNSAGALEPEAAAAVAGQARPPVVRVSDLRISYGKLSAVRGVSFEIPRGEVFGFIGPNGAGKSSTIRVLATLQREFRGTAEINGVDVRQHPERVREMVGYMPDAFGVYEDLNAREYLHFFAAAFRIPRSRRASVVDDVLQLTDLTHKIDAPVDSLSRGMKQRLALARVLLHDPDLLLLDEPASGLDPRARIEFRELLKALQEMGKTILVSSHILQELAQFCTRIGILEAGQIVADGSLQEIYRLLSIRRVVHVQTANDLSELAAGLRGIAGVSEVEEQIDRLAIHLCEDVLSIEDLHQELVRLGARIRMFQPEAMDMETAFMKLTQGVTA